MPFRLLLLPLILMVLLFSGCLQVHTVVRVNTDGSGTIEESVTYGKSIGILKEVFDADGDELREVKDRSRSYGDGVSYVSSDRIRTNESRGHRAVYAFKDINAVRLNQNPNRVVNTGDRKSKSDAPKTKDEFVTFRLTRGQPARLTILMPQEERSSISIRKDRKPTPGDEGKLELARWLLGDFAVSTVVEVEGRVVGSNATFRRGSNVTLIDIDLDDLLDSEGFLEEASQYEELSLHDAKTLMKKYPGIKVELNKEVTVSFQK